MHWRAVMKEVDRGCSEFCIAVGTVTRTAIMLIHSHTHTHTRLMALCPGLPG